MDRIITFNPKNDISMIKQCINKYQASYKRINFRIGIGRVNDPQSGSCDRVEIIGK